MKTKDPIGGNFRVLVVPEGDVEAGFNTLPMTVRATRPSPFDSARDEIRVMADRSATSKGAAFWAMGKRRDSVVAALRDLADYLEKYGKDFDALTKPRKP